MSHHRIPSCLLAACAVLVAALPAVAQDAAVRMDAETVLVGGNSTTYTTQGTATGLTTGDWGPWTDDQREPYFAYEMKDGRLLDGPEDCNGPTDLGPADREGGLEVLDDEVSICWSEFGVPAVFGDTYEAAQRGHGWAAAKLRLFLLEATWRTANGSLSELAGEGSLAQDVERRTTRFTDDEYAAMVADLPAKARTALDGYVEGVNAYVDWVSTTGIEQLPAEYVLLQAMPTPLTAERVAAIGVELTRFVASEGRNEILVAQLLRELQDAHGRERGRAIFRDLHWVEDGNATVTVLPEEGVFPRTDHTPAQREAAFEAMADWAVDLPLDELASGQGIDPTEGVALQDPTLDSGLGDGTGDEPFIASPTDQPGFEPEDDEGPLPGLPGLPGLSGTSLTADDVQAMVARMLATFANAGEGASFAVAMAPSHTADGSTLLMSEPQLDYDGANVLMEVQVTGPGIDARGSTVAGLPVVGIGYTHDVAWALTTGNSKTIDSYVETTRRPDPSAPPEYLHDGRWKQMDCRTEDVAFRRAAQGVPVGPALESQTIEVCRTVHGPVVSHTQDWTHAVSRQWHMAGRELETFEGFLDWNDATSLADIERGVRKVSWNENIVAADSSGRIGFWHPGIHLAKAPGADLRMPLPGTGEFDNGDPLPFAALPQVVDPERGWITNWNNKPALGWLDGGGSGTTSYPASPDQRNATLADLVSRPGTWTFDTLLDLDREVSRADFRARTLVDLVLDLRDRDDLTATEAEALDVLADWDRDALAGLEGGDGEATSEDPATVGAAATLFDELVEQLDRQLFTDVVLATPLLVAQQYLGRHISDVDTHLTVALRSLDPEYSTLDTEVDWLDGRTPEQVLRATLAAAVDQLVSAQGDDVTAWRGVYFDDGRGERGGKDGEVCTATGVLGPCARHVFLERGAWVHHVGWTPTGGAVGPGPDAGPGEADDGPAGAPLPATGGGAALAAAGLLAAAGVLRRRRG